MRVDDTGAGARRIADDLWLLDTLYQGVPGVIASYLLTGPAGPALIDVGSGATVTQLVSAIRSAGCAPQDIRHLVLTHVHLDHAGAAGTLTRMMPDAQVYVHPLGARHLIDPSKLIASAERIYGDRMQLLWGVTEPVPPERVVVVADGAELQVGSRTLEVLYTPGHAVHHVALYDAQRSELFAGDVAGVRLEPLKYVRPPTPPPDLNLEEWTASIERMRALHLGILYLPHFGVARGVEAHLRDLQARLYGWGEQVLAGMRAGKGSEALAADLAAGADPELGELAAGEGDSARQRYELATNYLMTAQGYERYYQKYHPERLLA
jgi:glyoxylase-like metal-dependent hydrolase (beta-lactamase superfamily II)